MMQDDQPLAADMLIEIGRWLGDMCREADLEQLSYGELREIDQVYDIIKED